VHVPSQKRPKVKCLSYRTEDVSFHIPNGQQKSKTHKLPYKILKINSNKTQQNLPKSGTFSQMNKLNYRFQDSASPKIKLTEQGWTSTSKNGYDTKCTHAKTNRNEYDTKGFSHKSPIYTSNHSKSERTDGLSAQFKTEKQIEPVTVLGLLRNTGKNNMRRHRRISKRNKTIWTKNPSHHVSKNNEDIMEVMD